MGILSQKKVVDGLKSKYPGLSFHRIPVCNSGSPTDNDYDLLTGALTGTKFNAPVVINCQVGLSRSTTGGVIACLFREYQVKNSFSGLLQTVPGLNLDLLKMDTYQMDMEKDPLFRGEFTVVKELLEKYPAMNTAKNHMLIVFTGYLNDIEAPKPNTAEEDIKLSKSFADFMKDNGEIAIMIQKGKGKLKWERDVPADIQEKLEKMAATDFYGNLGKIIHDILGAANKIYRDMADVGDHKKRAKYRFSSKTLMSLLPADELKNIEDRVERGEMTVDFYDILGEVQKNKPATAAE